MSKVFIFLAITIMMLSIGSFMVNTPEFNTVQTNQNELIDITQQITTDNETDLVIFNGSMLTPEITIPISKINEPVMIHEMTNIELVADYFINNPWEKLSDYDDFDIQSLAKTLRRQYDCI